MWGNTNIPEQQHVGLGLTATGKAHKHNFKRSERLRSYGFGSITHTSTSMQCLLPDTSPAVLA